MLFNSGVFLFVFLPAVLLVWWALPSRMARLVFLTLASYVFYGWWDYRFVPLMVVSSSADLVAGYLVARAQSPARKRLWLVLLLVFNLGILGFFRYHDFFAESLNALLRLAGWTWRAPLLHLVLPVGISFYTFNSISYTIDVYRSHIRPTRSVVAFSAFVAMFPHLVAGPIIRYADMDQQFATLPQRPRSGELATGAWFFVVGMVKKVLVADLEVPCALALRQARRFGALVGPWLGVAGPQAACRGPPLHPSLRDAPPRPYNLEPDGFLRYTLLEEQTRSGTLPFGRYLRAGISFYRGMFRTFTALDPGRVAAFREMLAAARQRGIVVDAFIPPLHPELLRGLAGTPTFAARMAETEALLRRLEGEGLLRRFDFGALDSFGADPREFFDGQHMMETNASRLLLRMHGKDAGCAVSARPGAP